ncbi:MAG: hypothetical protein WBF84_12480 [Castellaniella sp.]|uniref:hypothetical protein n=1 Tax=Castellaniella sp. TaxID=1955812 RepID=UPI003C72CBFF
MATPTVWMIRLDEDEQAARLAASQLQAYGLTIKGQRWPDEAQSWLVSAQEAAEAHAGVVLVTGSAERYAQPALRRGLALFRLSLQTRLGRVVNGYTLLSGPQAPTALPGTALLADWTAVQPERWQARVVARLHAPVAPAWPVRLGLHAHERLGIWLESHPAPGQTASGALTGVAGEQARIDFHAVGPAGRLPDRTHNEYELQGLEFEAAGQSFHAWGLRNSLPPESSYYTRLDGEPDVLACGMLPEGEPDAVSLIALG